MEKWLQDRRVETIKIRAKKFVYCVIVRTRCKITLSSGFS